MKKEVMRTVFGRKNILLNISKQGRRVVWKRVVERNEKFKKGYERK